MSGVQGRGRSRGRAVRVAARGPALRPCRGFVGGGLVLPFRDTACLVRAAAGDEEALCLPGVPRLDVTVFVMPTYV